MEATEKDPWTGDHDRPWWGTWAWLDRLFEYIPWKWPQRMSKLAFLFITAWGWAWFSFWLVDVLFALGGK